MEYQRIINLLDNTLINSQIEFKTSILKSKLCGYSDVYTLHIYL